MWYWIGGIVLYVIVMAGICVFFKGSEGPKYERG
jgi:hypothetical protein